MSGNDLSALAGVSWQTFVSIASLFVSIGNAGYMIYFARKNRELAFVQKKNENLKDAALLSGSLASVKRKLIQRVAQVDGALAIKKMASNQALFNTQKSLKEILLTVSQGEKKLEAINVALEGQINRKMRISQKNRLELEKISTQISVEKIYCEHLIKSLEDMETAIDRVIEMDKLQSRRD